VFSRKPETAPIVLYGKLPLAKDYLRVGFGAGGALSFREWLDGAYSGRVAARTVAGPMEFIGGSAWDTGLVGLICPSSDAGGLRAFPFVLAIERKPKRIRRDLDAGLTEAGGIHDELLELFASLEELGDGESLLNRLRGRSITVGTGRDVNEPPVALETWLAAAWPGQGRAGLHEALSTLQRLAERGYRGPLRLPLVADLSIRAQVRAWLHALDRLGVWDSRVLPSLFYPAVGGEAAVGWAALVVLRDAARPDDARWLEERGPGPEELGDLWRPTALAGANRVSESTPKLSDSMRGLVTRHLARGSS